jgi:hypothetical protein
MIPEYESSRHATRALRLNPGLPPELEGINKALEKARDLRYEWLRKCAFKG